MIGVRHICLTARKSNREAFCEEFCLHIIPQGFLLLLIQYTHSPKPYILRWIVNSGCECVCALRCMMTRWMMMRWWWGRSVSVYCIIECTCQNVPLNLQDGGRASAFLFYDWRYQGIFNSQGFFNGGRFNYTGQCLVTISNWIVHQGNHVTSDKPLTIDIVLTVGFPFFTIRIYAARHAVLYVLWLHYWHARVLLLDTRKASLIKVWEVLSPVSTPDPPEDIHTQFAQWVQRLDSGLSTVCYCSYCPWLGSMIK